METKLGSKKKIYLIIFIAFAVVVLAASTYAYLTNSQGVGDLLETNTSTAQQSVFASKTEGELDFNITAAQMSQMAVSTDPVMSDNALYL